MKIVFLDTYSMNGADISAIAALGEFAGYEYTEPWQIAERARGAGIVITNKAPLSAETISALPGLKLICVAATGMNNIDLEAAAAHGVAVRNAVGYSTDSVAETTLSYALALLKQLHYNDRFVKSGEYAASSRLFHFGRPTCELAGKRWGVAGLGNIGRRVAWLAAAFGCEVAYYSTSGRNDDDAYERKPLGELLAWCDILSVHSPLTPATENLIGAGELAGMKRTAIIINAARGGIVNEAALAEALNGGKIAAAASDVFTAEPISAGNPLLKVADPYKTILTPHSAWASKEAIERLVSIIAENIGEFIAGR